MTIKVLITEDHELYRDGLRLLLEEAIPGMEVIEAEDFPAALEALSRHPDIALMLLDIQLPGTRGLDGLRDIKTCYPALSVVVVSTIDHQASIQQMLQLGADGFIAKTSSRAVMVRALRDVMAGESVIIGGQEGHHTPSLPPRQLATLELMALGLSNKEIAAQLTISPATVREYVSDLLVRFDCANRTQAVLKARRLGYILD
ncbi:two component transcriptional regulator, LuxR family [Marinobacter segnicrescens]|uniref:Two component transcriptional regulator, LuxR family n=1 Tax=Marinobacter segnicrescens TaxID=430453 RepID=A0A1I0DIR0_9GAMM|nr:response regulator transcription factor [Marinobacter segnicrescens]SET32224.1 two component transcriptional regulator, LuxR family [Marinobacter segnicrescens]